VRTLKLPFREAHHITGRLVAIAATQKKGLEKLSLAEMQAIEPRISEDVFAVLASKTRCAAGPVSAAPRPKMSGRRPSSG